jgi:hypothetical protein
LIKRRRGVHMSRNKHAGVRTGHRLSAERIRSVNFGRLCKIYALDL